MDESKKKRPSFEETWQDAFEQAEETPSAQLWTNIESAINASESSQYKRRFIFYRNVAAAAVACLLVLGIFTFGDRFTNPFASKPDAALANEKNQKDGNKETAQNNSTTQNNGQPQTHEPSEVIDHEKSGAELADNASTPPPSVNQSADNASAHAGRNENFSANPSEARQPAIGNKKNNPPYRHDQEKTGVTTNAPFDYADRSLTLQPDTNLHLPIYSGAPVTLASIAANGVKDLYAQPIEGLTVDQEMYRIPVLIKKDKKYQPVFFAGVNVSTDYFNPNFNSSGLADASPPNNLGTGFSNLNSAETKLSYDNYYQNEPMSYNMGENNTAQLSFSYGVSFGWALSKHWSLESGIDYGRLQTSTATSLAVRNRSNQDLYPLLLTNNTKVGSNTAYSRIQYTQADLSSSFDFFSVPMKIGYNLNFNKINLIIASGVSANFFVKNSVTDNTGQLNALTIKAGDGPFRNVYYSALLSSGVNYNIWNNYFIAVVPTYSFSINSLSRSESSFTSQPYSFGVDFGIRYLF